jgi:hypothetical protein
MKFQSGIKVLLASAAAACCIAPAGAQSIVTEISGDIQSFQGGWTGGSSQIGQPVVFDFSYDLGALTNTTDNGFSIESVPITSAGIVGGILGTGIDLEQGGPGTGSLTYTLDLTTNALTLAAGTSTQAPYAGFTGAVYGFSLDSVGTDLTLDLIRDVYSHGSLDRQDSGTVALTNLSVGQVQAPEIDPASALSGLTLLIGSLAVVRGRKSALLQPA